MKVKAVVFILLISIILGLGYSAFNFLSDEHVSRAVKLDGLLFDCVFDFFTREQYDIELIEKNMASMGSLTNTFSKYLQKTSPNVTFPRYDVHKEEGKPIVTIKIENIEFSEDFLSPENYELFKKQLGRGIEGQRIKNGLPIEIYTPTHLLDKDNLNCIFYVHGGGWALGSNINNFYENMLEHLAYYTDSVVISVYYPLSPRFKFPIPVDSSYFALQQVMKNYQQYKIDPNRISVIGDSAGGNIAGSITARSIEEKSLEYDIYRTVLIYPVTDYTMKYQSYTKYSTGYLLSSKTMNWFWTQYIPLSANRKNKKASIIRYEDEVLEQFPPTLLLSASADILLDEGLAFINKLDKLGCDVKNFIYEDNLHGYIMDPKKQSTLDSLKQIKLFIN